MITVYFPADTFSSLKLPFSSVKVPLMSFVLPVLRSAMVANSTTSRVVLSMIEPVILPVMAGLAAPPAPGNWALIVKVRSKSKREREKGRIAVEFLNNKAQNCAKS